NIHPVAQELEAVGKPLQSCRFARGYRSMLGWMAVPPTSETIEANGDRRTLAIPCKSPVHVGPSAGFHVRYLVARQSEVPWDVLPSSAWRYVGEPLLV